MRISVVLIIWFLSLPASGQLAVSFISVDTASYNAYLKGDWNAIIDIGNKAIDSQIDYYYLRMRMGYAWFMKNRYRKAVPHYKKALEFSRNDPAALEYLFYCYEYSGRPMDAEKLVAKFPESLKNYLDKNKSDIVKELGFNLSFASGATEALKEEIIQTVHNDIDGIQKAHNHYSNYQLMLRHRIGRSVQLSHSASLLFRDEFALSVVNSFPYLSESQSVRQFNYHLGVDITPLEGFTLKPTYSYIRYKIPIYYEYGQGSGKNREVYDYIRFTDFSLGLQAIKQVGIFRLAVAGAYSEINESHQALGAASFSIYPLANLNLYYSFRGYYLHQNNNSNSSSQGIHSHELGFKVMKNLWCEVFMLFGEFTNFYDVFTGITYNSLEQYNRISGINLIVPLYKSGLSFFAGYRYYQSESLFVPANDPLHGTNNKTFNYQTITGGFIWKL